MNKDNPARFQYHGLSNAAPVWATIMKIHIHAGRNTSARLILSTERRVRCAGLVGHMLAALLLALSPATLAAQEVTAREIRAQTASAVQACAQCHGANGEGQPAKGFPRLAGQGKQYLIKQVHDFRAGRRMSPIMEPIAKALDDATIEAVSTFYQSIVLPEASARVPEAKLGPADVGAKLATHGNWDKDVPACFACHGAGGAGIAPHFPAIAPQNAAYTEGQLRAWKSGARINDPQGIMKSIADRLSEADIDAVAAYLESSGTGGR